MGMSLAGAGLVAVHFMDYGFTGHYIFPDHGVFGAILFSAGFLIGLGKPGTRAKKPGKEE